MWLPHAAPGTSRPVTFSASQSAYPSVVRVKGWGCTGNSDKDFYTYIRRGSSGVHIRTYIHSRRSSGVHIRSRRGSSGVHICT